jgi:two-component system chemotaxis sensor kinase CheA
MGVLHTVKGTAASVGLKKIAEFSHRYEDFVSAFQKGHKPFTNSSLLMISRAFDVLKRDINDVLENGVVHAVDPEFFNRNLSEASDEIEASSATPLQQARGENISLPANSGSSPTVATPATPSTGPHSGAVNNKEEKVFVSLETLNDFISTAANLTTIRSTFGHGIEALRAKYACDKDILSLIVTLNQFAKEISKLQTTAEDLRRVSLVGVFKPMKRMVRELSATLGKDVQFKVNGEDLRVDRSIATLLGNCLVHLFRNCVDHGIEPRDERINKSKPPQGTIHCTITQNDSWVEVEIVDDGKGINPEIVKKKALANSLYSERELNEWPLERILMIIFEPGFSTATTVSDISGRGVGTDMVKRSIEDAGGSIRLTSTVNQGTRFHIRIPIPKSSEVIKVFLVAIHQQVFAVPTTEVVTILKDDIENNRRAVEMMHSKDVLYYDGVYLPVVQAALGSASTVQSNKTILVLQKPNESKRVALSVDSVLVSEEVILKELENFDHFGFSGYFKKVALLGNSRVALLLDVDVTERIHADKSERARDNALERIQGIAC